MSKFINSQESVDSSLLLWQENPTQVAIEEIYDVKVHPISGIFNEGTINFDLPPQPKGLLSNVEVVTTFRIKYGDNQIGFADHVSVVNNIANSMWALVDVKIDDRVSLMQSMRNSYAYQTFFNNALNHDNVHEEYLFANELFLMDSGKDKADSQGMVFGNLENKEITNAAAVRRADRFKFGNSVTTFSKLHCSLFTTNKALPTSLKIRISFTRNSDAFLLLSDEENKYRVIIEDVYLLTTYQKPRDVVLKIMDERLKQSSAVYYVTKPEIIVKPINQTSKVIRMNDLFHEKLPKYAFFCIQGSEDFEGKLSKNPFTFIPFSKFQFFVNGTPYFADPLEMTCRAAGSQNIYDENAIYLRQLYKTIGKDLRGNCLINRDNFQLNFIVGLSLTSDRCNTMCNHLNLQEAASTHLEIHMGTETLPDDALLVIYAMYDRQILIDHKRAVTIVE